jgi:acetylornithine deacetylase
VQQLFELTRQLVDIESVTGAEGAVADFVVSWLRERSFDVGLLPVSPGRANVFATLGRPDVVLSTHLDTVAPFFPSSEDAEWIYGRGSCDAKGCLACQAIAADQLARAGVRDFGLLFLAGEEWLSDGARAANQSPPGSRFLVMGEPTDNRLIVATKGVLQLHLRTRGRTAHSAYPYLGDSAIETLLDLLGELRAMPLPLDPVLGPTTMNIGLISGGLAANVVPDAAEATILYRTVDAGAGLRRRIEALLDGRAEFTVLRHTPPTRMEKLPGFEISVASFTTDVPSLDRWGRPLLLGPGSILLAHTAEERVRKDELSEAVEIYRKLVLELKARCANEEKIR